MFRMIFIPTTACAVVQSTLIYYYSGPLKIVIFLLLARGGLKQMTDMRKTKWVNLEPVQPIVVKAILSLRSCSFLHHFRWGSVKLYAVCVRVWGCNRAECEMWNWDGYVEEDERKVNKDDLTKDRPENDISWRHYLFTTVLFFSLFFIVHHQNRDGFGFWHGAAQQKYR